MTSPKPSPLPPGISAAEAAAIRAAVEAAERETGGEIVPLALAEADEYPVALWKGAALFGLAAALAGGAFDFWRPVWLTRPEGYTAALAIGMLLGGLAGQWIPALRRWLCGGALLERRLELRAREAFLAHQVFATRDRTGILIAVAAFEHRVTILADQGIHAVVPAGTWERLAGDTAAVVRSQGPGAGLLLAVERAGAILRESGLARRSDDRNELADEVRS